MHSLSSDPPQNPADSASEKDPKKPDQVPDSTDIIRLSKKSQTKLEESAESEFKHAPLEKLAKIITRGAGSTPGFVIAALFVGTWIYTANTGHSNSIEWRDCVAMVTLLMTFLIQRQSNKNMAVMQLKLDEIIASHDGANNGLIKAEDTPEEIIMNAKKSYKELAAKHRNELYS